MVFLTKTYTGEKVVLYLNKFYFKFIITNTWIFELYSAGTSNGNLYGELYSFYRKYKMLVKKITIFCL